jgi:hypothetical protein
MPLTDRRQGREYRLLARVTPREADGAALYRRPERSLLYHDKKAKAFTTYRLQQ